MSYNYSNENKIKRRKVSSSNSHKNNTPKNNIKKEIKNTENIEKTIYKQSFDRRNKKQEEKEDEFEAIEQEIYNRKKVKRLNQRKKIMKNAIKSLAVLLVIISVISSVVIAFTLKGAPIITKDIIESNYISSNIVDINEVPDNLKNAFVATEDRRFYEHNGVEIKSLVRSAVNNLLHSSTQGGSTIDMQVSKNLLTSEERSMNRKIKDIYNALQMNKVMTKDEILSAYLNNIYFGKGSYGVVQASRTYFGEDVRNLSLAQCAMLAGITNNPARYMQHDEAKRRQKTILYNMKEQGYITEEEYRKAVNDPTPFKSEIA